MSNPEVYIWADGCYHNPDDGEPPTWKSDDYFIVELPEDGVEDIDAFVLEYIESVNLGTSTDTRTALG